jgi:hypothetical protein
MERVLVYCHSGYAYAERPLALRLDGQRQEIDIIEAQWRHPGEIGFKVRVQDGRRFELVYLEVQDAWRVEEI